MSASTCWNSPPSADASLSILVRDSARGISSCEGAGAAAGTTAPLLPSLASAGAGEGAGGTATAALPAAATPPELELMLLLSRLPLVLAQKHCCHAMLTTFPTNFFYSNLFLKSTHFFPIYRINLAAIFSPSVGWLQCHASSYGLLLLLPTFVVLALTTIFSLFSLSLSLPKSTEEKSSKLWRRRERERERERESTRDISPDFLRSVFSHPSCHGEKKEGKAGEETPLLE